MARQLQPLDVNLEEDALPALRSVADRVGRGVESFATKLDSWYKRDGDAYPSGSFASLDLIAQLSEEVEDYAKELTKKNERDLAHYTSKCSERKAQDLRADIQGRSSSDAAEGDTDDLSSLPRLQQLFELEEEVLTWALMYETISNTHAHPLGATADTKDERTTKLEALPDPQDCTERELFICMTLEDECAAEILVVLRTLQSLQDRKSHGIKTVTKQLEEMSGTKTAGTWSYGWLDTRERIKQQKRLTAANGPLQPDTQLRNTDGTEDVVTELDLDAPGRQGRALERQDKIMDQSLWMSLYDMLIRGKKTEEIHKFLEERGQLLLGFALGLTPDETDPDGDQEYLRTKHRECTTYAVWRRTCLAAARDPSHSSFEQAVWGLRGGDLQSVLQVARSWDEVLYAHFNALLWTKFDERLSIVHPANMQEVLAQGLPQPFDAIEHHGGWNKCRRRVVEAIRDSPTTREESREPMKLIQGAIIARDVPSLVEKCGFAVSAQGNADGQKSKLVPKIEGPFSREHTALVTDEVALRTLVHVTIALKALEEGDFKPVKSEAIEALILGYIDLLRMAGKIELIPTYAEQLLPNRPLAERTVGRCLPDIHDNEERRLMLSLILDTEIDMAQVLGEQSEFVLQRSSLSSRRGQDRRPQYIEDPSILVKEKDSKWPGCRIAQNFSRKELTEEEELLIGTAESYLLLRGHWRASFICLSELMKNFLLSGRISAAVQLGIRVSWKRLAKSKLRVMKDGEKYQDLLTSLKPKPDEEELWRQGKTEPSEEGVNRKMLRKYAKPYADMEDLCNALMLVQVWRDAEESYFEHRRDGKKWPREQKKDATSLLKAKEGLEGNIDALLKTFLLDEPLDDLEAQEFAAIRRIYLPSVILAYLSAVQFCGLTMEPGILLQSMELANTIAADDMTTKTLHEAGKLQDLVSVFARNAKAVTMVQDKVPEKKPRGWKGETMSLWNPPVGGE